MATMFTLPIALVDDGGDAEGAAPENELSVPVGLRQSMVLAAAAGEGNGADSQQMQAYGNGIGNVEISVQELDAPNQPVMKEGFLHKRGDLVKNWRTRYFRLIAGRLVYFKDGENSSSTSPLGSILLPQATLAVFAGDVHPGHPYCFGISPADGERQYVLDCDSAAHRTSWMQALQAPARQRIRVSPDSAREGFLVKRGATVQNYKRRYMILSRTALKYHSHFSVAGALGSIPLGGGFLVAADDDEKGVAAVTGSAASASAAGGAGASSSAAPSSGQAQSTTPYGFILRSHGSDRVYHFLTSTRADRDGWVSALQDIQRGVRI